MPNSVRYHRKTEQKIYTANLQNQFKTGSGISGIASSGSGIHLIESQRIRWFLGFNMSQYWILFHSG